MDTEALVASVTLWVHKLVAARVAGIQEREDAAQEAFLALVRHAPKYDPKRGAPTTWAACVVNSLLSRRGTGTPPFAPLPLRMADPRQRLGEEIAGDADDCAKVRDVLARLGKEDRTMLEKVAFDGLSIAQLNPALSRQRCHQKFRRACNRARRLFQTAA